MISKSPLDAVQPGMLVVPVIELGGDGCSNPPLVTICAPAGAGDGEEQRGCEPPQAMSEHEHSPWLVRGGRLHPMSPP
jgi:hypothetical protein